MAQLTEEELKNMSPEEIAQLQKQNCIFCHIISGKVPSKKVYEDDISIAILDIHPAVPGHVLILPKEHYAILPQVPEDVVGHMFMVAKQISHAMLRAFQVKGTNIVVQNGAAADQKAPHFMIHIIPRDEGDGLGLQIPKSKMSDEHVVQLQQRLIEGVKKTFGIEKPVQEEVAKPAEKPKEEKKEEVPKEEIKQEEKKPEANPIIEQLKNIIQMNPQLKDAIKQSPEQVLEVVKNQPQLKDMFTDLTVEDLKAAIEDETEEDKPDLDSVSSVLGALGGDSEDSSDEDSDDAEPEEDAEEDDDSDEEEDDGQEDESEDEEQEESGSTDLDSISNLFK